LIGGNLILFGNSIADQNNDENGQIKITEAIHNLYRINSCVKERLEIKIRIEDQEAD
jgi:hypothetical protein